MKIPGFTAEASVYTSTNIYYGVYSASSIVQQIDSAACTCTNWKCPPSPCGAGWKWTEGPYGCPTCYRTKDGLGEIQQPLCSLLTSPCPEGWSLSDGSYWCPTCCDPKSGICVSPSCSPNMTSACSCTNWKCRPSPKPSCRVGEKCCEPNSDGGCNLCVPIHVYCP